MVYIDLGGFGVFPGGASGKESACQCRRPGLNMSLGREDPLEEEMATYENPMDRGVEWALVHRVAKSWTRLK